MRIEKEQAIAVIVDYQEKLVPVMNDKDGLIQKLN